MSKLLGARLAVLVALGAGGAPSPAQCVMDWAAGFEPRGVMGAVYALGVFDDGTGPALYAGGDLYLAGGAQAKYIAKWDGASWTALPSPPNSRIYALGSFDDGSGPGLYAGGQFTMAGGKDRIWYITKWNGRTWEPVGPGLVGYVRALCEYDDGSGPALYAGGSFRQVYQGPTVNGIAKWDGKQWSALGSGMWMFDLSPAVFALAVYDKSPGDGPPALHAGGHFIKAGGVEAYGIAQWDGTAWSAVDGGVSNDVYALAVYDDGTGPALYAAGRFTYAGGNLVNYIAKWDGKTWSALDRGMDNDKVYALAVYDDGSGPALYAGGYFETAGGVPAFCIARWDGQGWAPVGSGVDGSVRAMTVFDDGRGPALYIGGEFEVAGGVGACRIARWDGKTWSALGDGNGTSSNVYDVLRSPSLPDNGGASVLYAAGDFGAAGGVASRGIASWDGTSWAAVGGGVEGRGVQALTFFDDGTGPALYVGGYFPKAGGRTVNSIAKWDGANWHPLGSGVEEGSIYALTTFDDGAGPALYAGGIFTKAGGILVNRIAKWDGSKWSALDGGLTGASDPYALALAVFDDGRGPALYVGGRFIYAGQQYNKVNNLARWDGRAWSAVGGGVSGTSDPDVRALGIFDDGQGPALYVGGDFKYAGNVPANYIAKWDGTRWSPVAGGVNTSVWALGVHDDGRGPALYAGGSFTSAGGVSAPGIAKWDGARWWPLGAGISGVPRALATLDDGQGPALYLAGGFSVAGGRVSVGIARWGCIPGLKLGDTNCDGKVDWLDIDAFVLALCRPGEYERLFPNCRLRTADCNTDGVVNNFDIDPFVKLLTP